MNDEKFRNYTNNLIGLIKKQAMNAKKDVENAKEVLKSYFQGVVMGYHAIINLLKYQAFAFRIDQKELGLANINPDEDLLDFHRNPNIEPDLLEENWAMDPINEEVIEWYLQDTIKLMEERAIRAKENAENAKEKDEDFLKGWVMAYCSTISLLKEKAPAFNIDIIELNHMSSRFLADLEVMKGTISNSKCPTEIQALNALCQYLEDKNRCYPSDVRRKPFIGSTVPDFTFKYSEKETAIEVTQTGNRFVFFKDHGFDGIKDRLSFTDSLREAFNIDLEKNGSWIKRGDSVALSFTSLTPQENDPNLVEKILDTIKDMYLRSQIADDKRIENDLIPELKVPTGRDDIKEVSFIACKSNRSEFNKTEETEYILKQIIRKNHKAYAQLEMPKWMILIGTHPHLRYNDYKEFFARNADFLKTQDFEKFYLIENGGCLELYSS